MSISFAGVDLLLEDPGREFQTWLERSLSLRDLRLWGDEPIFAREGRDGPQGPDRPLIGLPMINWPAPPQLKINSLYVPTGATRWGFGLFLVDGASLAKIEAAVGSYGAGTLKITEQRWTGGKRPKTNTTVSGTYYMLPARRVVDANREPRGYLLVLVDRRYFWQFQDTDRLLVGEDTTWDDVLSSLSGSLGCSLSYPTPAAAYLQPDPDELTRRRENLAATLDAVAVCLGWRCVFNAATETLTMQTAAAATSAAAANLADNGNEFLAGGEAGDNLWNTWPAYVRVVYREEIDGRVTGGTYETVTPTTADGGLTMPSGTEITFHDTCHAIIVADSAINSAQLNALTTKIAADYSAWLYQAYDLTYLGVAEWTLSGFDDYAWYHYGYLHPADDETDLPGDVEQPDNEGMFGGDYACFTRVATWPANVGVSELLHATAEQFSSSSSSSSSTSSSSSSTSSSSSSTSSSGPTSTSSSSATSSSASTSQSSTSTTAAAGECILYGPTAYRKDDYLCIPKYRVSVVNGVLTCRRIGEDCIDVCDCAEYSSSSETSSASSLETSSQSTSQSSISPGGETSSSSSAGTSSSVGSSSSSSLSTSSLNTSSGAPP